MTASARFAALTTARLTVLDRARKASSLTIPGLVPDEGQNEHASMSQPYQSLGARCVANLSSTLQLALFPPNLPFFRLTIDESTAAELGEDLGDANAALAKLSRTIYAMMESANLRPIMFEVLRHLIVAGNVLAHTPENKPARLYRIDQYVVRRNTYGEAIETIVCEKVYPSTLPIPVQVACGLIAPTEGQEVMVDVFTRITREGENVSWVQEIKNIVVPGSKGTAPADASPWLALRWLAVPGSDYGRSHVTEYLGDFLSLEDLYKSMVQFAAVAARIVFIVDPNSGIDIEELTAAETGDFITGYKDRISALQLDKFNDWQVMKSLADELTQRLSAAFLLRTGVTRNAERVTAEEIRLIAQELENILGGTYTVLSSELQLPLVRRHMHTGQRSGKFPKLPKTIAPTIVTGFDALGRAAGVNRLRTYIADLASTLGPDAVKRLLNEQEVAKQLGAGHGVDGLDSLLKSADDLAAEAEAAKAEQMGAIAAPHIAKAAGEAALQDQPQEPA